MLLFFAGAQIFSRKLESQFRALACQFKLEVMKGQCVFQQFYNLKLVFYIIIFSV
jgi:hypothetical protein